MNSMCSALKLHQLESQLCLSEGQCALSKWKKIISIYYSGKKQQWIDRAILMTKYLTMFWNSLFITVLLLWNVYFWFSFHLVISLGVYKYVQIHTQVCIYKHVYVYIHIHIFFFHETSLDLDYISLTEIRSFSLP